MRSASGRWYFGRVSHVRARRRGGRGIDRNECRGSGCRRRRVCARTGWRRRGSGAWVNGGIRNRVREAGLRRGGRLEDGAHRPLTVGQDEDGNQSCAQDHEDGRRISPKGDGAIDAPRPPRSRASFVVIEGAGRSQPGWWGFRRPGARSSAGPSDRVGDPFPARARRISSADPESSDDNGGEERKSFHGLPIRRAGSLDHRLSG